MGERSVPMTAASGCSCAISMAQIPVPVAMSRMLWNFVTGAEKSVPFMVRRKRWCWRSGGGLLGVSFDEEGRKG